MQTLTRRQFLSIGGVALMPIGGRRTLELGNAALELRIEVAGGAVAARSFANRLTGRSYALPVREFELEFDDGLTLASDRLAPVAARVDDGSLECLFSGDGGVDVRVRHILPPGASYLRKQISVRQRGGKARRLLRADLECWDGVPGPWTLRRPDRLPYGSHPVHGGDVWAGVEFVVAFNECGPDGFTLRSRPGGPTPGADWMDLRSTAVGVARPGGVRDAFLRYIDDIRLAPPRMVACYNSWWTLPKVVTQKDNLALIREIKEALHGRHGVFFDIVTTDMGWSHPQSIWEIDRSLLPNGFDDIRAIVEPAGGRLGLWMSPSEVYPPVCDYEWAEKAGYRVLRPERDQPKDRPRVSAAPGVSLADPRFRAGTKTQLAKLIRENGFAHIKYDGFWAVEYAAHNGLLPGDDSVEPLAAYSLELLQASKEANPDLVTEPTYQNSIATYISPWILKYSDTVWANAMDCVVGLGPAPDFRESHTNAREAMVFRSVEDVWLPQNAVHHFDIVHVDSSEGFANHAAMAFARGRFFLSTYVNPKLMNDDDWRVYAGLLRWARRNAAVLRHTVAVPSRVELGEPYAYAHWLGRRGILAVRNPSNENRAYALDLARCGAPGDLADAVCVAQFPYRRGIAAGLDGRSRIALDLAPWEVLFLDVAPRLDLTDAVAIGARWYRGADRGMTVVADAGVGVVRVLRPGGEARGVAVTPRPRDDARGELVSCTARPAPEGERLRSKPRTRPVFPFKYPLEPTPGAIQSLKEKEGAGVAWAAVPTVAFEVECAVTVPADCTGGRALLLVEFSGRECRPGRCGAWIDGREAALEERCSEEHIGYYDWTPALRPYESDWRWYLCDLKPGTHRVRFAGAAGHPNPRLGLWLWSERTLDGGVRVEGTACGEPALPQVRDRVERRGVCLMPPRPAMGAA